MRYRLLRSWRGHLRGAPPTAPTSGRPNPRRRTGRWNIPIFARSAHSPLAAINTSNAKSLKLLFAVPLGGKSAGESIEATPLVDDGFMYMVDRWGVVSKIDVRSGTIGKTLWKMDPKLDKQDRNRGVALWGNLVISVTGYAGHVIATDRDSGQVVWDRDLTDQEDL